MVKKDIICALEWWYLSMGILNMKSECKIMVNRSNYFTNLKEVVVYISIKSDRFFQCIYWSKYYDLAINNRSLCKW